MATEQHASTAGTTTIYARTLPRADHSKCTLMVSWPDDSRDVLISMRHVAVRLVRRRQPRVDARRIRRSCPHALSESKRVHILQRRSENQTASRRFVGHLAAHR